MGLCLGLVAGIALINVATFSLKTARDSNIRPIVKYALEKADPSKPQLLLIGSSYTALGVDSDLVARALHQQGYPLQVLDLAKPGNYMISQDYTLDYYLARAKKVPEFVFIEIGPEYYNDTGAMGPSYIDTGTAIADHSLSALLWRSRSIAAYGGPPAQQFNDYWNLMTHTLFHVFDFGLSGQLVSHARLAARAGFDPEETARNPVKPSEIQTLTQPAQRLADDEQQLPANVRFIIAFRKMQIAKLKARGVKVVGFYQTEMAPLEMRDYGKQVCYELKNVPCIIADDPALQRRLDNAAYWYDPVHLLHPGAEIYSSWFGQKLAAELAPYRSIAK